MKSTRKLHTFLTLALFLVWSALSFGQAISGDLVGTVQDPSGAGVPNAAVTATNDATGIKTSASANGNGEYRLSNLPPGTYTLTANAPGFGTSTLNAVIVNLNKTATVNLTLQVSSTSTTVEVSTAVAQLDTSTAQIQTTYTNKQLRDSPSTGIGNGVLNLSLLNAGVSSSGGVGVGQGPSVGGQRPRNNNFTVEGIDNNAKSVTGPLVFVPNESVAEFTLLQNQFQAEYGHSSGGQFSLVVKGGGNRFHGTLYDYMRNRKLNALDQTFANQGIYSIPRYDQNHLGANFGGPIKKDKLFFFTSFEYNPIGKASTTTTPIYAPTQGGYATLAAVPGVSQTNLNVLKTYAVAPSTSPGAPNVTVNNVTVPTGIIPVVAPNYQNSFYGVLSMDYNISDKDQLRGRYIYNRSDTINTTANLPVFYTLVPQRFYLGTLAEYHTFSSRLTNEFRLGFQRQNQSQPVGDQSFPGLDAFPNLLFRDLGNLQVGPNPNYPQSTINNMYQAVDNVTWMVGKHTIKVGSEFRDYISPQQFSQRIRGDYEYTQVANYLLDLTPDFLAQRNVGKAIYYGNQLGSYSYIQDTWRVRPNLTLNLGVRYEYTTVPLGIQAQGLNALASVPGLITFKAPEASPYAIGPRVGFAWTPDKDGNTVIRAGFGMAYDVIFDNVGLNAVPPQFATTVNRTLGVGNNFLANGGITQAEGLTSSTAAAARAASSAYLPDQLLPYSINYSFEVQHVFAKDYTLNVRYLGTRGVHLITQQQLNRFSPVTATQNIPTFMSAPSAATLASLPLTLGQLRSINTITPAYLNAGFTSTITAYTPQGYSNYNGLSVQLNRRFSHGLQYQFAYTWSHNLDNSTAEVASTYLTPRRAEDFQNLRSEWGSSALDRRHRLTLSLIYDAPWFKSRQNWFLKNLVGNWEIAPIYTYESPEYFTAQSGVDSNLNADAATDRAIVNPAGADGTGSAVYGLTRTGAVVQPTAAAAQSNNIVAYVPVNPNARYIQAGPGAVTGAGRNTVAGRPIDNLDLSLIKRFTFRDRYSFDITAQALNLLNHPQYIAGSVNDTQAYNSFTSGALGLVSVNSPVFNRPDLAFSSSPRFMQIAARFNF